jgi:GNAT superfamily N-acetyltransferase/RimJ/RimL family protein N-acetyltransferase
VEWFRATRKALGKARLMNADIEIRRVAAPLAPEAAWEVESLLLKIFEYGDYSFRSALRGEYCETLDCTFFLARHKEKLIGAAGCLCGRQNPGISILGPVGVDAEHRGNNVGSMLVKSAIDEMKDRECAAIYLGTSDQNGVADFYKKLGFQRYLGIVMRHLMCSEGDFEDCFSVAETEVRRAVWGDFPAVCALATVPASFYTFDLPRGIFSSKYVEPTRFLSIFPRMMKEYAKQGGLANVLTTSNRQTVVGIAGISRLPSKARRHVAELDFFVHDNFIEQAERLVRATLEQSKGLHIQNITCYCLGCDHLKRSIIDKIGGRQIAVLRDNAFVNGKCEDVLVHQLGERAYAKD